MRTTSSPHLGLPPPTILVVALALAAGVLAQGQTLQEPPKGLTWGPVVFTPSLLFGYAFDSNVFQQSEILAPESDAVWSVEPTLGILVPFSNSSFRLTDRYRFRDYAETVQVHGRSSNEIEADLDLNFGSLDRLEIGGLRVDGVAETLVFDPGGEVVFSGESYRSYDAHVELARDDPGTRGYRVEIGRQALRFDETTDVPFFDYHGFYADASYLEPLRASMNLSLSYRGDRFEHFQAGEGQNAGDPFRTERGDAFYAGVEGRLASHRPYSLRIGWQELKFGSSPAPDFKGIVLNGNVALTGGRKTVVTIGADRTPYRSFFFNNNFYVFDDVRASVVHRLWRASELGASLTLGRLSYDDAVPPPDPQAGLVREDTTVWIDAYANFALRDLVVFRLNFRRTRRDSNYDAGIFDQNVFFGGFVLGWF
jgi:hypothetical protein